MSLHENRQDATQRDVPTADEARRRAFELLDQAFATQTVSAGDPWGAPEIRAVLPHEERVLYVAASQAYATLAGGYR